ncbi:hypothetical protein [Pseudofulvibacter geojedonensis]|uniref:Uncharacterized protein n=1 Tax=Pseudofulvibacter geojedonensis TaxID=1123758 RepID=A0ABW3I2L5_9FLAO
MLQKLATYLLFGNRFYGIEASSDNNEDKSYRITSLRKHKKELVINLQFKANSIDLIANKLPKNQHAFLIINTNHVLFKKVTTSNKNENSILNAAFPNINAQDFYYEIVSGNNNIYFVALCRKKYVDSIIDDLKAKNILATSFSLGNSIVTEITDFISLNLIQTSNAQISLDSKISDISIKKTTIDNNEKYNINGLLSVSEFVLSLSGAITSFLSTNNRSSNSEEKTFTLFQDFKHQIVFKKIWQSALLIFLGTLLINFFLFNHYFNKVNELQQTAQVNTVNKNAVLSLDKKLQKTQKLATDILKSNASKSSFYINEIIKLIPNSILLSELNYQPLKKRIKKDQSIQIENNTIIISGVSSKSDLFFKWIKELENTTWIKTVETLDYNDIKKSKSEFSIKLYLKHEE